MLMPTRWNVDSGHVMTFQPRDVPAQQETFKFLTSFSALGHKINHHSVCHAGLQLTELHSIALTCHQGSGTQHLRFFITCFTSTSEVAAYSMIRLTTKSTTPSSRSHAGTARSDASARWEQAKERR